MFMNKIYTFLLGSCILALQSCGDFLEEVSQDEFEPKTTEAFRELLNGEGYTFTNSVNPLTYMMDDDIESVSTSSWDDIHRIQQELYTWQPDFYAFQDEEGTYASSNKDVYKNLYELIMACNIVDEHIDGSQGTDEDKTVVRTEALSLRAFYYLQLINLYAYPYNDKDHDPSTALGVPLVLTSEVFDEGKSRNTVKEVYDQIAADIEQACDLFNQDKISRGVFRMSYTAAHLLASRVYLYMENWNKVIEHATYALETAPELVDLNNYTIDNNQNPTNGVISRNFPETIFLGGYRAISGSYGLMGSPFNVSSSLFNLYTANDLRIGTYLMKAASNLPYNYMLLKFSSEQEYAWRTSELYLNRAEAYIELYKKGNQEDGQNAINDLNVLLSKRYRDYEPLRLQPVNELQKLYREERRKELCFEGFRWFDLRRYGMPQLEHILIDQSGNSTRYILKEKDPSYVLPLPDNAMEHNANLIQNELSPRREGSAM